MDRTEEIVTDINGFVEIVWDHAKAHPRQMPWREQEPDGSFDPYKIMVSEIMLQQTQVSRVIPKFNEFIVAFPSLAKLAEAPLREVLLRWNGLGYNRRARFLHEAAKQIITEHKGIFPHTRDKLIELPGIGANTAAAILVYAYNQPLVFIETNIRTVYIYHFFTGSEKIDDKKLLTFIEKTADKHHPREWNWALMDYGSYLKQRVGNVSRYSKHYAKQSVFHGSKRQIRGEVIRQLLTDPKNTKELHKVISDSRLAEVLNDLVNEKLVTQEKGLYKIGQE